MGVKIFAPTVTKENSTIHVRNMLVAWPAWLKHSTRTKRPRHLHAAAFSFSSKI
jgi:hypothetical protein